MDRAQAFKEARRYDLVVKAVGGEDHTFEVRSPTIEDLIHAGFDPIVADVRSTEQQRQAALETQQELLEADITKFGSMCSKLLVRCGTNPKIFDGPELETPKGSLHVGDIGDLKYPMGAELLNLIKAEAGEVAEGAANFRVVTHRKGVPEDLSVVQPGSNGGAEEESG